MDWANGTQGPYVISRHSPWLTLKGPNSYKVCKSLKPHKLIHIYIWGWCMGWVHFMWLMFRYSTSLSILQSLILCSFIHIIFDGSCDSFLFYTIPSKHKAKVKSDSSGTWFFGVKCIQSSLKKILGCQLVCAILMATFLSLMFCLWYSFDDEK